MTQRERDRLVALRKADKKLITQKQAAQQTGLSERHLRRLLAKLRSEGDQAVVHAARGRASNRKLSAKRKNKPWQSSPNPSTPAFNYLEQRHGVQVGRETLRRMPPRACGSPAAASQDARIRGGPAAVAAASWCNGTPPSTTGWRDAGRSCT